MHRALEAGEQIASPRAFVATVTTRLAIDELRSARARREHYVGEWLPEPIITDGDDDPASQAETADSLSVSMLVLLESLSPEQRAVLLLHDVFDYGYPEIAAIVGKSEDNVRQLASRARRHVEQRRPRFQTTREQRDELAQRFSRPPSKAISPGSRRCSLRRGAERPTAAARFRRSRGRCAGEAASRAGWSTTWAAWSADRGVSLRPVEVNGGPGALYLDAQAAADRRGGARDARRRGQEHQLDRQPREADAPRATRRPHSATEVGEMTFTYLLGEAKCQHRGEAKCQQPRRQATKRRSHASRRH